ncbi:CRISPR-associated protein Cmr1 [Thermosyntropha lipolytica DSM 11003]|uniref:CRISPR-associated protein Cmr1 n=1 Tax=Thermosyntropha lipolytica DSM 11003 TaxID=1123382 RepID=A0A1M5R7R8_9FIRM|nr:type III-B CRISPR module RAMP protein Cmr1 [Thermosyntropha lipolytica]SHH22069.1 CRISPR-associated protein Cmr1 [Thermosyntropha lipolytica DSM 11003]
MRRSNVNVVLETITPLWTGNAWQENNEVRPSSLMGSLRFWFEVICFLAWKEIFYGEKKNTIKNKEEKLNEFLLQQGVKTEDVCCFLKKKLKFSIPEIIFGDTGWKGLISLKNIKFEGSLDNSLGLPERFCFFNNEKEIKTDRDCPRKRSGGWAVFFFGKPYFWGKLELDFWVVDDIIDGVFYPLLNFMDDYGYWGGKWNLGYGRLKIVGVKREGKEIDIKNKGTFNLNFGNYNCNFANLITSKSFTSNIPLEQEIKNFLAQKNIENIKVLKGIPLKSHDLKDILMELVQLKQLEGRRKFDRSQNEKHKIYGKVIYSESEGSKILPYIVRNGGKYDTGYLSLTALVR